MTNIFMDTQVFVQENFGFNKGLLSKIVRDANDGLIKVYLTEIVKREVESEIYSQVYRKMKSSYGAIEKEARILKNIKEYENLFGIPQQLDTIYNELLHQFNDFLNNAKVTVLLIEKVSPTEIFDRYFNEIAPFSVKKKNEFPDAFSLLTLENYFEGIKEKVRVISDNLDLETYCEKSNNLIYEATLQTLNNYLNESDKYQYHSSLTAFRELKGNIEKTISSDFASYLFNLVDEDGDVEILKVNTIIEIEPDIIEFNYNEHDKELRASISLNADIDFKAIAKYVDYLNSYYDKEEGEYLFKIYKDFTFTDKIDMPLMVTVIINSENNSKKFIIDEINNGYAIEIRLPIEYEVKR